MSDATIAILAPAILAVVLLVLQRYFPDRTAIQTAEINASATQQTELLTLGQQLRSELRDELESAKSDLKSARDELKQARADLKDAQAQLERVSAENVQLKAENLQLKSRVTTLEVENGQLKERVDALEQAKGQT